MDFETEEFEEVPQPPAAKGKGKKGGKRNGNEDQWHSSWSTSAGSNWRSEPYTLAIAARPQTFSAMQAPLAESIEALARSEASARAAARVARQAAVAFDDEAAILSSTLKKLQACVDGMGK